MLLKLTFAGYNKVTQTKFGVSTLVNLDNVKQVYSVYNKHENVHSTKIEYVDGSFINVTETLEEIYEIQKNALKGKFDDNFIQPSAESFISSYDDNYNARTEEIPHRRRRNYHID